MNWNKFIITISLLVVVFTFFSFYESKNVLSSAPSGGMALVASSTQKVTVGTEAPTTIFNAKYSCTNRVITTYANPIMLTFATSTDLISTVEPTATFGHLQSASTTMAYDSGLYGCGVWQVYGYTASTTISISEFEGWR